MTRHMVSDVYTTRTIPARPVSTPHPKQLRRRRAFAVPQNAYDPSAPDLLHVVIA
ncbi:hypothetical protein [Sulfobacillus thermosulfidooxidans]|uniref:hypothetical protein n=1 Tax=Sulfobacillus thermosulfidooxidans TaxID=28034 RepID=UPI0002E4007D|nr:hypothetical protein [Sulfobacillus thermosulfidooxidans]